MDITIDFPVNSYIFKIFQKDFGNPYRLSTKKAKGKTLLSLLRHTKYTYKKYSGEQKISIIIGNDYFNRYNLRGISEETISQFCSYLDASFRERLFIWLDSRLDLKLKIKREPDEKSLIKIKDSIHEFCSPYNFSEEEISTEALIKNYYRLRVSKERTEK